MCAFAQIEVREFSAMRNRMESGVSDACMCNIEMGEFRESGKENIKCG
jgi:hypothetical protein